MLILAVDTSGKNGSLALVCFDDEKPTTLGLVPLEGGTFSAQLVPQIAALLQKHHLSKTDIDAFAVVSGPGSFTGLRVGLAAIKALAEIVHKPIVAVSLLEAVACADSRGRGRIVSTLDAGRGEVYSGIFELECTHATCISQELRTLVEFVASKDVESIVTCDEKLARIFTEANLHATIVPRPTADAIARLGYEKIRAGETVLPEALDATYIRRSDAEIKRSQADPMSAQPKPQPGFIIVWEFRPQPEKRREFEEAYGPEGNWARFFRRGDGYVRTELHADTESPRRYFTLDFWESRTEFETFKQNYSEEYKAMDAKCESLTMEEKFLGFCDTREQVRALLSSYGAEVSEVVPQTVVRAATQADVQTMLLLEQATPSAAHWSEKTYQEIFDAHAPTRLAFVAQNTASTLVGFVVARLSEDECELENIVVTPGEQRCGIGQKLLRALIDAARAEKAGRLFLEVRESNIAARTLYERSGFVISGRRSSYYGAPQEDALLYELKL